MICVKNCNFDYLFNCSNIVIYQDGWWEYLAHNFELKHSLPKYFLRPVAAITTVTYSERRVRVLSMSATCGMPQHWLLILRAYLTSFFLFFPTNFGFFTHGMDQTLESEESWLPRSLFISGAHVFLCGEELKQFKYPLADASSSPYFSLDWCCCITDVSKLVTCHLIFSFHFICRNFLTSILQFLLCDKLTGSGPVWKSLIQFYSFLIYLFLYSWERERDVWDPIFSLELILFCSKVRPTFSNCIWAFLRKITI